jgi:hypothetical protein
MYIRWTFNPYSPFIWHAISSVSTSNLADDMLILLKETPIYTTASRKFVIHAILRLWEADIPYPKYICWLLSMYSHEFLLSIRDQSKENTSLKEKSDYTKVPKLSPLHLIQWLWIKGNLGLETISCTREDGLLTQVLLTTMSELIQHSMNLEFWW